MSKNCVKNQKNSIYCIPKIDPKIGFSQKPLFWGAIYPQTPRYGQEKPPGKSEIHYTQGAFLSLGFSAFYRLKNGYVGQKTVFWLKYPHPGTPIFGKIYQKSVKKM